MLPLLCRTLVTGAVGSLLLDWYGWQSVFYVSGGLTLLWVCYVYRYLLSEQGNRGRVGECRQRSCQEGQGLAPGPATAADPGASAGRGRPHRAGGRQQLRLRRADGGLSGLGVRAKEGWSRFGQTACERGPTAPGTVGDPCHRVTSRPTPGSERLSRRMLLSADLILAMGVLGQGLPAARDTRVPWRQLFRKPSVW